MFILSTPCEGDRVKMEFLIQHQKVSEKFLRLGCFREESAKFSMLNDATSLMQVSSQDDKQSDMNEHWTRSRQHSPRSVDIQWLLQ